MAFQLASWDCTFSQRYNDFAQEAKVIALFLPSLEGGGAERVMLNLARGLVNRDLAVDLVLAAAEGSYLNQVPSDVDVVNLGARRVLTSLPKLVRYLKCNQPAALLSTLTHANLVVLWARRLSGSSTWVVVRESNALSRVAQNTALARVRLLPLLARCFYRWADGIVAVSQGVAEDLARITSLPLGRIRVIYNPVGTSELLEEAKKGLDHPWFAQKEPPVVLGVGRLTKQKDFSTLIHAFALVRQHYPARLMILGEGEQRSSLGALVCELGLADEVALPGFVENPYAYMARAAVLVLSSAWEGLPNVLIEAMAVGTPVVATDCGGGPVEILENGRYGRLVPVGDADAMAEAILVTINRRPTAETLQWRASEFSTEKIVDQYLEVLRCA
jgi:glycosyltransferase involved in cell wall biosynthesis